MAYDLEIFLSDVNELMVYTIMPAIFIVLWRIFVTNRSSGVLVLGLDESSLPPSVIEHRQLRSRLTTWTLLLYVLTGVATFELGLVVSDLVQTWR